jgi:hypothetical protein
MIFWGANLYIAKPNQCKFLIAAKRYRFEDKYEFLQAEVSTVGSENSCFAFCIRKYPGS